MATLALYHADCFCVSKSNLIFVDPVAAGPEMGLLVCLLSLPQALSLGSVALDEASGLPQRLRTAVFSTTCCTAFPFTVDGMHGSKEAAFFKLGIFRRLALKSPTVSPFVVAGEGHFGGEGTKGCLIMEGNTLSRE